MAELLVRVFSEDVVEEIHRRAVEHGVSAEEEARTLLGKAVGEIPAAAKSKEEYTLFDHLMKLAEVAPDIDFAPIRTRSERPLDL